MSGSGGGVGYAATRAMQTGIVLVFGLGAYAGNPSVMVNAAGAFAVTFLPAVIERDWEIRLDTRLTLWISLAVLLHAVGMLGPYNDVSWWDHVTHTLSATVVAGVGYATTRALDEHTDAVSFPSQFLFVYVLLFTLAFGVLWEVLEFGARILADHLGVAEILVQYGLEDTIVDLMFDSLGAVLVSLFGTDALSSVVASLTAQFERASPR